VKKTQVYYKESGHLGQYEEWWHVIQHDDGSSQIENSWHNVKVNGLSVDKGSKTYSLDDGLRELPAGSVAKAKEILGL